MIFTGKTKNLGLIGYPVEHSLSPVMQNPALQAAGLDYAYIAMSVEPENLGAAVQGLRVLGFHGFNVTIPHKVSIMEFLDELDENARRIGAVNTVVVKGGRLYGHNTDATGFIAALAKQGFSTAGKKAVVLGAGGAARAVIWGLIQSGIESIVLGVRNPAKAKPLADEFRAWGDVSVQDWSAPAFESSLAAADLLVNTTPLGMHPAVGAMPPVNWDCVRPEVFVYDIVYVPQKTEFLRQAEARGHRILNGEGMLVEQGAAAFKLWTQRDADADIMTKELRKSLGNS